MAEVSERTQQDRRAIFSAVMEEYEKIRSTTVSSPRGGIDTHPSPGKVQPCLSDFVCDVELAGRRVLTKAEFKFFKDVHLDQIDIAPVARHSEVFKRVDDRVMQKVGREFQLTKIYPVGPYFRPKYIKPRKRA